MAFVIIYLILAVVFAVIGSEMAKSRNRDAAAWALICALLPLLGIVALERNPI
ncbi:PLDc N-terminal domain-containing protein [Sinorhizobium medicae]|uniref:PLDc N-terminal domain-containing protein n=1 Tax=Sinorhizobium medicae TaxID=110321 RepID=UPI0013E2E621|nr:PLDc N-terminal domain-containing protein [Sinorhizobium medicae]